MAAQQQQGAQANAGARPVAQMIASMPRHGTPNGYPQTVGAAIFPSGCGPAGNPSGANPNEAPALAAQNAMRMRLQSAAGAVATAPMKQRPDEVVRAIPYGGNPGNGLVLRSHA